MTKVSFATLAKSPIADAPLGMSGEAETRALFDQPADPIHAYGHELAAGAALHVGSAATDRVLYVWKGAVTVGGQTLSATSSIVVERGAEVELRGLDTNSVVVSFAGATPPETPRAGGHVHLLPAERVPRGRTGGALGAMHANAQCPTCEVWLHESSMPPRPPETPEMSARGIHAHSENEVIFIIGGEMRFGTRVLGPGSAVAIRANAFYTFGVGPEGLAFVNFRAGRPTAIRFKAGGEMDEVGLWRDSMPAPEYLAPA